MSKKEGVCRENAIFCPFSGGGIRAIGGAGNNVFRSAIKNLTEAAVKVGNVIKSRRIRDRRNVKSATAVPMVYDGHCGELRKDPQLLHKLYFGE